MRRRINDGLPKYCQRRKYGVIYQPYLGRENGRSVFGKAINLGPPDMQVTDVWLAYNRETNQESDTLRWLLAEFHAGAKFKTFKPRTQSEYEDYRRTLTGFKMANGREFGTAKLDRIKRTSIQRYLDKYPAPISANRQIQYLKSAWNWALNRYDHVPENPCKGVELNKQTPRERYVTADEYRAVHTLTSGWVTWAMELAYLCRARRNEILALTVADILPEGLRLERSKKSKGEITKWTPRLRAAVDGALKHSYASTKPIASAPLLLNNYGQKLTARAWNSALGRLRPKMIAMGIEPFTLHDLKAAGYSDQRKQDAGHRSEKMHDTYMRKLKIVEPPE